MGKLIYSAIMSLDGYVADENGNFDWAAPDEEVHFLHQPARVVGWHLSLRAKDLKKVQKKQNFLDALSNSGPAVRLCSEDGATGRPKTVTR